MLMSRFFFLLLLFLVPSSIALAQAQVLEEKETIVDAIRDMRGEGVERYLRLYPEEITVVPEDHQEKPVPLRYVESVKLEKIQGSIPGTEHPGTETYYSVRLQNSQGIFTLHNQFGLSLNTNIGIVTRTIDPEIVQDFFRKDPPAIYDKIVAFSLEFKF
jgi:hypothetical protein